MPVVPQLFISYSAQRRLSSKLTLLSLITLMNATAGCGSSPTASDSATSATPAAGSTTAGGTGTNATSSTNFGSSDRLAVKGLSSLALTGCVPSDYVAPMMVGGTEFQLLIDSGSSSTALAASSCSACSALSPLYDLSHGTSTNLTASTQYGDNSGWQGTIYSDTVAASVGTTALTPPVTVNIVAITQESSFFTSSLCPGNNTAANSYQGILGLGPDTLLEPHTTSWMGAVQTSGKLSNNAYAVQICDYGGRIWFGGYDPNYISGNPQYTPMVQTGAAGQYYSVNVADMQFAGKSLGLSSSSLGSTVVDTGTSSFIVPTTVFEKYATGLSADANFKANFPSSGSNSSILYSGGCTSSSLNLTPDEIDAALPSIGISFPTTDGQSSFTLTLKPTESYLYAVKLTSGGFAYCSSMTYSSSLAIFGNSMMREHVVVFDRDNELVGFVPQAPCGSGYPTASLQ